MFVNCRSFLANYSNNTLQINTVYDIIICYHYRSNVVQTDYVWTVDRNLLLSAQKGMANKGKMKVTYVNESLMEIFKINEFSDILNIEKTKEQCIYGYTTY